MHYCKRDVTNKQTLTDKIYFSRLDSFWNFDITALGGAACFQHDKNSMNLIETPCSAELGIICQFDGDLLEPQNGNWGTWTSWSTCTSGSCIVLGKYVLNFKIRYISAGTVCQFILLIWSETFLYFNVDAWFLKMLNNNICNGYCQISPQLHEQFRSYR